MVAPDQQKEGIMFQRYDMSKAYQEQLLRDAGGGAPDNPRLLAKVRGLGGSLRAKLERTRGASKAGEPGSDPSPASAFEHR